MNVYFIIAGTIGIAGGIAHTVLGHRWTVRPLPREQLASAQFTGDQNKRYLTWFWHIGSVVLVSTSVVLLLEGMHIAEVHRHLLLYISFLWLSMSAVFLIVALKAPLQVFRMVPGLAGMVVNAFILAGLLTGQG